MLAACLVICCGKPGEDPVPGSDDNESVTLTLADAQATAETKALYANLWALREKGWMFGHHDDLMYGRKWKYDEGGSDTKAVCGDYPGVYSLDFSTFMDDRVDDEDEAEANALRLKLMKQAYDRGMVITACLHLNDPLTGDDAWLDSGKTSQAASEILKTGSATQKKCNGWLDRLASMAKNLKGSDGKTIPVIIRPFHEHTQTWSWWGKSATTEQEFVGLWKYFVDYLRKAGVHNFIYAISPQMDSKKEAADFLFRWPGDNYVDFIGMDCYQGIKNDIFLGNLKLLSQLSTEKKKPCGVTETGVEGFKVADYWITNIAAPMAGRKMSLLVTWRNKYDPMETGTHYFSVFPGHVSEDSFKKMYSRADTFFCGDLPKMYQPVENITVQ